MPGRFTSSLNRWWCWPLATKPPVVRKSARKTEAHACKFCGSVAIIGGDRLRMNKNRAVDAGELRHFCDLECAGEFKKVHNKSQQYMERYKNSAMAHGGRWRLAHEKREQEQFIAFVAKHVAVKKRLLHAGWWVCMCCGRARRGAPGFQCSVCRGLEKQATKNGLVSVVNRRVASCERCNNEFTTSYLTKKFCSSVCASRYRKRQYKHRRRVRIHGAPHESISLFELCASSDWKCTQCECVCNVPNGGNDPKEATIDHIIPLSKGGFHVRSNAQLLCRRCNTLKSDSLAPSTQLLLPLDTW
jgi:hypothetical protein